MSVPRGQGLGSEVESHEVLHSSPMLLPSFLTYAGISNKSWATYRDCPEYKLEETCEFIEQSCTEDILSGAMVGAFNANLAARISGIADKSEVESTVQSTIQITGMEVI